MPLVLGFEQPKQKSNPPKRPALTKEEKEIIKNRDLLENLDLLQDLEKFRLFDLFTGKPDPEPGKDTKKPEAENSGKNKK